MTPAPRLTPRQVATLDALILKGDVLQAAAHLGIRYRTACSHLREARARSGLKTEQLIALGVRDGWLWVPRTLRFPH